MKLIVCLTDVDQYHSEALYRRLVLKLGATEFLFIYLKYIAIHMNSGLNEGFVLDT